MIRNIFMILASAFVLYSCIGADMSENNTVLSSDQTQVSAQAEFASEGDNVKTVIIRSNRSWFAHLDDLDHPVDPADPDARVRWATLSVERHQNLTNTTDETEILITFKENFSAEAVNGVLNIWCEGKIACSIPVTQGARVFHIAAHTDVQQAKCDSDVVPVSVDCNTRWTAKLADTSTADVQLETTSGDGTGMLNVIFGENFSRTEDKTAEIVFSARGCEDYVLTIRQSKAVPYVYIMPEYDGKVISGESAAVLKIRSNVDWSAEVVESDLDDFSIVNESGEGGTSEPQEVKVTFKANDSTDPFDIKTARIQFTAEGMEQPVEYEFSQRGVFVVSFEDATAFSPEIANSLVSNSGQPNNLCRPDRVNTDVDTFTYAVEDMTMALKMSQYIRHDASTASLYVMGAGKLPHITFSGFDGLTLCKMSVGFTGAGWFSGNIVAESHELGSKTTVEYTEVISQATWSASSDGSLHYIDFDLSQKGVSLQAGQGCTLRTSSANNTSNASGVTKMYIKSVTFKYL